MSETFGERLRRVRRSCGLTQHQLEEIAVIGGKMVSRYENDVKLPTAITLEALSDVLGVTMDYLWKGDPNNER